MEVESSKVEWFELAACKGKPTDWFYDSVAGGAGWVSDPRAVAICASCPVIQQCWDECRSNDYCWKNGVWAGSSPVERQRWGRERAVPPPVKVPLEVVDRRDTPMPRWGRSETSRPPADLGIGSRGSELNKQGDRIPNTRLVQESPGVLPLQGLPEVADGDRPPERSCGSDSENRQGTAVKADPDAVGIVSPPGSMCSPGPGVSDAG